jgi:hypothetical protein
MSPSGKVIKSLKDMLKEINSTFRIKLNRFIYNNKIEDARFLIQISSDESRFFIVIYPDYSFTNCSKFDAMLIENNIKISDLINFVQTTMENPELKKNREHLKIYPFSILMRTIQ